MTVTITLTFPNHAEAAQFLLGRTPQLPPETQAEDDTPAEEPATPRRGRGRPRKDATAASDAAAPAPAPAPTPAPAPAAKTAPALVDAAGLERLAPVVRWALKNFGDDRVRATMAQHGASKMSATPADQVDALIESLKALDESASALEG